MCLDWLFNMQIPESSDTVVIIRPNAKTFITGLASAYDETYDRERLSPYMTQHEFTKMIEGFNDQLAMLFPCGFCWCLGYVCCPVTLGLSLFCPRTCVNDAEHFLVTSIRRHNRNFLGSKGIEMALVKQCGTSWLELRLPSKEPKAPMDAPLAIMTSSVEGEGEKLKEQYSP